MSPQTKGPMFWLAVLFPIALIVVLWRAPKYAPFVCGGWALSYWWLIARPAARAAKEKL